MPCAKATRPSEQAVGASLRKLIEEAQGQGGDHHLLVQCRPHQLVAEAARDAGREVLVLGRSMKRMIDVAGELGYMEDVPQFSAEEEYGFIPRDKLVICAPAARARRAPRLPSSPAAR